MSSRSRRWWRSLLLALLVVVASDRVVERVLRRFTSPIMDMIEFVDAAAPPYFHLRPRADVVYAGFSGTASPTRIQITSFGLRDRERPFEKPPNVHRIVALGDSFTFGLGVE